MNPHRQYAVCQLGARMHYAVPRLLCEAGVLELFYTDICAQKGWPRLLGLIPGPLRPAPVRRLAGRTVKDVPPNRIRAFTGFGLEYARRQAAAKTQAELSAVFLWGGKRFCELIVERGLAGADAVYTFNSAGLELQRHAHALGIATVMEQTIAPREMETRLLAREHEKHPSWEPAPEGDEGATQLAAREREEWAAADLILCGSEFVRDGIGACGGPIERCRIVPYGVETGLRHASRAPHDGPLRVLTVGAVGLRKGSPYVLAAAKCLAGNARFRMAGMTAVSNDVLAELKAHVEVCGSVPRTQIGEHFAWADVFLLPSLCEGSATAAYEAMACGLPVIATPNTGSVVRDGVDGFIVPSGDAGAIVEKLEALIADPKRLAEMSAQAWQRSREFTLRSYGERLLHSLENL